jgi:hypothetical protein
MAIKASGGGGDFEKVPAGAHFAICDKVVYLGMQRTTFDGREKILPKVWLGFQIPDIQHEYEKDGKKLSGPAVIGRKFTLNIGDNSNLGPFLKNWRGRAFTDDEVNNGYDVEKLAGKPCQLGVIHEKSKDGGKTYANITSAGALMKDTIDAIRAGTRKAEPHGKVLVYNADEHDQAVYDQLPEFLRKQIDQRVKPGDGKKAAKPSETSTDDFNDDIPF